MHPKVVLDTNVIISAVAFPQGKLKFIWDAWKAGAFDLILSEKLFDEIERKINIVGRKYKMNFSEIREVLGAIRDTGIFVKVGEVPNVTRDPKDNIVVATAISGRADLLVSGDKDIQALGKKLNGLAILTPAEFLKQFGY